MYFKETGKAWWKKSRRLGMLTFFKQALRGKVPLPAIPFLCRQPDQSQDTANNCMTHNSFLLEAVLPLSNGLVYLKTSNHFQFFR